MHKGARGRGDNVVIKVIDVVIKVLNKVKNVVIKRAEKIKKGT